MLALPTVVVLHRKEPVEGIYVIITGTITDKNRGFPDNPFSFTGHNMRMVSFMWPVICVI